MGDCGLEQQLRGWSLTTAEIMYRMPDHRDILQTFVWQDYDLAPRFLDAQSRGTAGFGARRLQGNHRGRRDALCRNRVAIALAIPTLKLILPRIDDEV